MTYRLSLLLVTCTLFPLSGQEEVLPLSPTEEEKKEEEKENEDARFRIPLGAVISDLTLPYYGKNKQQISLLTAEEMTVEAADPELFPEADTSEVHQLNGKNIKLWLFDKDGKVRSTTTIPTAQYHVDDEQLVTSGELIMRGADDKFAARSEGAIFTLKTGQALLLGPGITRFTLPAKKTETTMNRTPIIPLTAAMQMLIAAPPEIDPDHLANFERLVAPRPVPQLDISAHFAAAELNNAALAQRLAEYLLTVGKTELLTQIADPPVTEPDPLDKLFDADSSDISIEFDSGAYLDSEALEFAYFGNIKVEGRGLKMTCNKDLKVIFNPPTPKENEETKENEKEESASSISKFGGVGELKQVTANGKIRFQGVLKDGQKFYLGGDRALFETDPKNPKKEGTVTIRGDRLAFIRGDASDEKSKEPLYQGRSSTKDAWAIIEIKQGLDPTKSDLTIQFSKGNWFFEFRDRSKN